MLYQTYRTRLPVEDQDPIAFFVQRLGGWMSVTPLGTEFSVPEQWGYLLYAFDPHIERTPRRDWIV